jgi:hypothetical protein
MGDPSIAAAAFEHLDAGEVSGLPILDGEPCAG